MISCGVMRLNLATSSGATLCRVPSGAHWDQPTLSGVLTLSALKSDPHVASSEVVLMPIPLSGMRLLAGIVEY